MQEVLKILVVDDDQVDRMAVHRALKTAGVPIELVEAEDCVTAIATLQQQPFDCVFLDYSLPDGDGLSLLQAIRNAEISVALIVLTGQGDEEVAVELMKAGASDYLSKAKLSPESLSRSLSNAIRIHQAEQRTALANQRLRESEERYRLVLEGSNDGIWDWDIIQDEIYCNDRLFEILGTARTSQSWTPQALYNLLHPEDQSKFFTALNNHLERKRDFSVEVRLRHTTGDYRYCICRGKAQYNALGKPFRMSGLISDITERKWVEEALQETVRSARQHATQLRGLTEAALAINAALSLDEVLQVITDQARSIIGAHQSVTSLSLAENWAQSITTISFSEKYAAWQDYDEMPDGSGIYSLVCQLNRPMRMTQAELEAHPAWRKFGQAAAKHPPLRGWLAAPLTQRDGRNMGLIQLSDKYQGEFSENDEAIIVQLAQMASVAIENTRLYNEAQVAEAQLRQQLQFNSAVTNSLGEGVYALDRRGCITFINAAAATMLGWTEAELLGKPIQTTIYEQRFDGFAIATAEVPLSTVLEQGITVRSDNDAFIVRRDSTPLPIIYTASPIVMDGEVVGAVVAFRDISERKRAEASLQRRFEQLQAIYQMTEAVSRAGDLGEIYTAALNGFQHTLKADRASVLLLDEDQVMRFKAWRGLSDRYRQITEGHSPWSANVVDPQPILVANAAEDLAPDALKPMILQEGIQALGFIPLVYQNKLLGKVMIYYNQPHQFNAEEVRLAQTIASHVAFATARKRVEDERERLLAQLETERGQLEAVLQQMPAGVIIAEAPSGRLVLGNEKVEQIWRHPFKSSAEVGQYEEWKGFHGDGHLYRPEDWPLARSITTGEVVVAEEIGYLRGDGTFGTMNASSSPIRDRDGQIVAGVVVFQDISDRKKAEDAQRFLAEASTLLSTSLDYQTTLETLGQLSVPRLADCCFIDLVREDGSFHRLVAHHADPSKAELIHQLQRYYAPLPNAAYGVSKVARTGQAELITEMSQTVLAAVARDSAHLGVLQKLGITSYMCVPLMTRGITLGVISFIITDSNRLYTAADLALAEDLAHRAALAVENARLYREAQEVGENLRQAILILGEQQQQLRALQRLTNLLNQRLADLPDLLQVMVRAVGDAIPGAQFSLIALRSPQRSQLELTAKTGAGIEKLHLDHPFYAGEGLLGQVFLTGESQLVQGEDLVEQHSEEMPASICAVAIESAQAGRLGVLAIGSWEDATAFDEEDRRLLVAFGEQAAIAINNAQLINALEEREERLAIQNDILAQQNLELEHQRQQIQHQNLQLVEAAQLKSKFLATMSHELRTPMNAIIGFSQLLLRQRHNRLTPQQGDMVSRILSNGKNLLTLINDILDLSKIEAGRLELKLEEFDLGHLVAATTEELGSLAEQKELTLTVHSRLTNPCVVNDSDRIRRILINLLSNAIKFTETGGVEVIVQDAAEDRIAISVKDTGIGIAETDLQHIFEEFRQVDQTTTRKYSGTGLGLAIVDWLVSLMDGSISVSSEVGKGSTFRVELPRCLPNPTANMLPNRDGDPKGVFRLT